MFHFSCLLKWGTALILWSNANSNWGNNQLLQKPGPENMESQNTAIVSIKRCPKEPLNHCTAGSLRNLNRIPASNKSGMCLLSCKYVGLARAFGIPLKLCWKKLFVKVRICLWSSIVLEFFPKDCIYNNVHIFSQIAPHQRLMTSLLPDLHHLHVLRKFRTSVQKLDWHVDQSWPFNIIHKMSQFAPPWFDVTVEAIANCQTKAAAQDEAQSLQFLHKTRPTYWMYSNMKYY